MTNRWKLLLVTKEVEVVEYLELCVLMMTYVGDFDVMSFW